MDLLGCVVMSLCKVLLGIIGMLGSGKIMFVEQFIVCFVCDGWCVVVIKYMYYCFDFDLLGKDLYCMCEVGSVEVVFVGGECFVLMCEYVNVVEFEFDDVLVLFLFVIDFVIVEGYKCSIFLKIEVFCFLLGCVLLWLEIGGVVVVVIDLFDVV